MLSYPRIILAITLLITGYSNAWEFSFFNKLNIPMAIAIQFSNSEQEPLYKLYIKPGTLKSFVPGSIDIPDIKWSFCLKNIYYIKDPSMAQRAYNFARVAKLWKKVAITWVNNPLEITRQFSQKIKPIIHTKKEPISGKKKVIPTDSRSLCKDRHFEITQDEYGNIVIIGSLAE